MWPTRISPGIGNVSPAPSVARSWPKRSSHPRMISHIVPSVTESCSPRSAADVLKPSLVKRFNDHLWGYKDTELARKIFLNEIVKISIVHV